MSIGIQLDLSKSVSLESDVDDEELRRHYRKTTSIGTRIERVKKGTSKFQQQQRQKLRDITSCGDVWRWYMRHPVAHMPALYFLVLALCSLALCLVFLISRSACFMLSGAAGLAMSGFGVHHFRGSLALRHAMTDFHGLNLRLKRERREVEAELARVQAARRTLRRTRRRLEACNERNKRNLCEFRKVEAMMRVTGQRGIAGMERVSRRAKQIGAQWRDEFLRNERDMLHAVYRRYERKPTKLSGLGMNADDFAAFERMLPRRYKTRFMRMGTFHAFANEQSIVDHQDFSNALDTFAEMEVDDNDIVIARHRRREAQNLLFVGGGASHNLDL